MKPNFLVIGAAKCGSTTISSLLNSHPDIYLVPDEVAFFAEDEIYAQGIEWYEGLFSSAGNAQCIGERSNHYTMKERYPLALNRLLTHMKPDDLKLIYIVRNPIEMIESYWIEVRSHGSEEVHYDFNVAVRKNRNRLINVANYWRQIGLYREYFADEQIHIVFLEDLKANQSQVIRDCYVFLGVDPEVALALAETKLNPSATKSLTSPTKSRLRNLKGYKAAVSLLPMSARKFLTKHLFMKKLNSRPQWNAEVKAWVTQELAQDTRCFLEYCGKPTDFWASVTNPE
ncbi:MAG: sulfotransferase domain-containing protein [Cyanobacteriota bacterium]|nr:sulfotransferase domain-containing protein [Cyanobacteriota bacterium]